MFQIKPIKNENDYRESLKMAEKLWDAELNTPEGDQLEILTTLIEKYESEHFHIDAPDPIEAIKFIIEQKAINRKELEKILGSRSRVSEILNKKRKLNLNMIRKLHNSFNIPYEILAEDYPIENRCHLPKRNSIDSRKP